VTDLLIAVLVGAAIVGVAWLAVSGDPVGPDNESEQPLLAVVKSPTAHVRQVPVPVMPPVPVAHAADVLSADGRAVVAAAEAILADDGQCYLDVREQDGDKS
jgi:hypothetical protein